MFLCPPRQSALADVQAGVFVKAIRQWINPETKTPLKPLLNTGEDRRFTPPIANILTESAAIA